MVVVCHPENSLTPQELESIAKKTRSVQAEQALIFYPFSQAPAASALNVEVMAGKKFGPCQDFGVCAAFPDSDAKQAWQRRGQGSRPPPRPKPEVARLRFPVGRRPGRAGEAGDPPRGSSRRRCGAGFPVGR